MDDSEADYVFARELLSEVDGCRFEVDWVGNYREALEVIAQQRHDIYLLDQQLDTGSGIELLRRARARGMSGPVVMLTGMSDGSLDRSAMQEGAADFLVKNELSPALLERSIRYAMERHRLLIEMENVAKQDALTGLANRRHFQEFLAGAMARAKRSDQILGLLLIDLDHFKEINDQYGHAAGDLVLARVGGLLLDCVRRGDLVARLGGDEFAVVLDDIGRAENTTLVAEKALEMFEANPVALGTSHLTIGASIGVAVYSGGAEDAGGLVKAADTAMYEAKALGRNNFQCFAPHMQSEALRRADLHRSLEGALSRGEMSVHYQAQFQGAEPRICGVEALVRWQRGSGAVPPSEFIPIAEESGQIGVLGEWVLGVACRDFHDWESRNLVPDGFKLAVNLSVRQLARAGLPAEIERTLRASGLDPTKLELEITETSTIRDFESAADVLRQIRALGVSIALDDFGTGHGSLSYLQNLPIQTVKIDRSFIRNFVEREEDAVLVKATLGMANALGLGVVAEGVETEAQRRFLIENQCRVMQGFLFHRPCPAAGLELLFRRQAA